MGHTLRFNSLPEMLRHAAGTPVAALEATSAAMRAECRTRGLPLQELTTSHSGDCSALWWQVIVALRRELLRMNEKGGLQSRALADSVGWYGNAMFCPAWRAL